MPHDFLKFNFSLFTTQVGIFFMQKRKSKIFGLKNVMETGIRKILTVIRRWIASEIFGKKYWNPCNFEKTQVSLGWPSKYKFYGPNWMHFWRSKSTLDSLKRVINVFRKKPSLVPPEGGGPALISFPIFSFLTVHEIGNNKNALSRYLWFELDIYQS